MAELAGNLFEVVAGILLLCATVYYFGVCYSAWRFRGGRKSDSLGEVHSAETCQPCRR